MALTMAFTTVAPICPPTPSLKRTPRTLRTAIKAIATPPKPSGSVLDAGYALIKCKDNPDAIAPSHVIALPNTWRTAVPVPCAHYSSDLELQLFSWLCAPRSTKGNTSGTLAPLGLDEATARALIDAGLTVYASYFVPACRSVDTLAELSRIFVVLVLADDQEWESMDVTALPEDEEDMVQVVQGVCRDNPLSRMGLAAVRALARSPAWHARFELVLWNMMAGILQYRWQQSASLPSVEEWWPVRRAGAGGLFGAALVEHALDVELPDAVLGDSRVQRMIELSGELVMLGNDLTSLANNIKEDRPMMNYVLLLKMLHRLPLEAAVEITLAKFQAAVAEFDTLAAAVEAGAVDASHATMLRDYASGLRAMVAGTVTVGSSAMRYKQYQVLDAAQRAVRVQVEFV